MINVEQTTGDDKIYIKKNIFLCLPHPFFNVFFKKYMYLKKKKSEKMALELFFFFIFY